MAHSHPFCELVVVLRGEERVAIGGTPFLCAPGHLVFYPPKCVHEECQSGPETLDFLCLDFEWPTCPVSMPYMIHDRQGRVKELVRWLMAEVRAEFSGRPGYLDAVTGMVAVELLRLLEGSSEEPLASVFEYVQEHFHEPISLDDLAACSRLNKFHLVRTFRDRTGMTPMEYVRDVRLEMAHRLLLETDLPLREIAPRSGFANEYHLSRLVKVRYGRGARDIRRGKLAEGDPGE